ncbi:MAG: tRNA (adenosine(37)-N6)-threonylcarbamoyltransferase complex transferase subunit TsaD [Dehalococcoidia bacterium]
MKVLGIETSCDETAAAIVGNGTEIISNVIASQADIHARYGGVVPEVASRQHLLTIIPVIESALLHAHCSWDDLDRIAVTFGPGLAGSLLVGVNVAKAISMARSIPLTGINHLEGHIYANWLCDKKPSFPCLCLIVSGGHSDLILMTGHGKFKKIGQTRDDASGEAFDKGARILDLGYPGGPAIESAAKRGTASFKLPRAWLKGSDDFSFSGLKTALLHTVQASGPLTESSVADLSASFQEAIIEVLSVKTIQAAERLNVGQIVLAGGVAANRTLCDYLKEHSPIPVLIPPPSLCTDNAAMIAACGYYRSQDHPSDGMDLDIVPGLRID